MKTKVEMRSNSQYGDYQVGDKGYIEAAVRGGDDRPCLVIVLENGDVVLAPTHEVKAIVQEEK